MIDYEKRMDVDQTNLKSQAELDEKRIQSTIDKKLQTVARNSNVSLNMMSTGKHSAATLNSSNGLTEIIKMSTEEKQN